MEAGNPPTNMNGGQNDGQNGGAAQGPYGQMFITNENRPHTMDQIPGNFVPKARELSMNGLGAIGISTVLACLLYRLRDTEADQGLGAVWEDIAATLAWLETSDILVRQATFFMDATERGARGRQDVQAELDRFLGLINAISAQSATGADQQAPQ